MLFLEEGGEPGLGVRLDHDGLDRTATKMANVARVEVLVGVHVPEQVQPPLAHGTVFLNTWLGKIWGKQKFFVWPQ